MLIYSKEKAEIRQKLSVIADDLKSLGVRVQELNALSSSYSARSSCASITQLFAPCQPDTAKKTPATLSGRTWKCPPN